MNSVRWKIILLCIAVILIPLALMNQYAVRVFDKFCSRELERNMKDSAFFIGEEYRLSFTGPESAGDARRGQFASLIRDYGRQTESRIQLLSAAGIAMFDSETNRPAVAEDFSSRREVKLAMNGSYGARFSLTDDRQLMFYFIAKPVLQDGKICAVAYVSRHTNNIVRAIKEMMETQRFVTASALAVGILLATILATSITSRLRKLTAATAAFARGDGPLAVKDGGRDEVAELAQSIERMAAEIQKTNHYNREFISNVTHELRMPITAIKGAAELLEDGAFENPAARGKFLGNIIAGADRLERMVAELNELTKLDSEVAHAPKEKVEFGKCVKEIVERFEPALDSECAKITVEISDKPVFVRIIPHRIEQVIDNLLDNAIRYTPASGTIEVKVEPGPDNTVRTSVRDSGCGIDPANVGKIFDRFFTTEPKDKPKEYGRGLGLAIAKSIVENHGGTISVESKLGEGATFSFSLPAAG